MYNQSFDRLSKDKKSEKVWSLAWLIFSDSLHSFQVRGAFSFQKTNLWFSGSKCLENRFYSSVITNSCQKIWFAKVSPLISISAYPIKYGSKVCHRYRYDIDLLGIKKDKKLILKPQKLQNPHRENWTSGKNRWEFLSQRASNYLPVNGWRWKYFLDFL